MPRGRVAAGGGIGLVLALVIFLVTGDPGALDATVSLYGAEGFVWASRGAGDSLGTLDLTFVRRLIPRASGSVASAASDHRPQWVSAELLSSL